MANKQNRHLQDRRYLVPFHKNGTLGAGPTKIEIPEETARDFLLENTGTIVIQVSFDDGVNWKAIKVGAALGFHANFRHFHLQGNGGQYEILFNAEGNFSFGQIDVNAFGITEVADAQPANVGDTALINAGYDADAGIYNFFRMKDGRLLVDAELSFSAIELTVNLDHMASLTAPKGDSVRIGSGVADEFWKIESDFTGRFSLWDRDDGSYINPGVDSDGDGDLDAIRVVGAGATENESILLRLLCMPDLDKDYLWVDVDGVRRVSTITYTSAALDAELGQTITFVKTFTYQGVDPFDLLSITRTLTVV